MTIPITKELREHAEENVKALRLAVKQHAFKDIRDAIEMDLKVAEFALAAMDAEPVADVVAWHKEGEERTCDIRWRRFDVAPGPLFAMAQPVPVSVPGELTRDEYKRRFMEEDDFDDTFRGGWNACRAAMLNHQSSNQASVDAVPGDEIKQRASNLVNEPVSQPYKFPSQSSDAVNEAAWKLHDTLTEHGPLNGHQFNNLKGCFYEALKVAMCNSPVIPDGWRLVPVEPTKEMIDAGWLHFMGTKNPSSKGTYKAMVAAAPQQERK